MFLLFLYYFLVAISSLFCRADISELIGKVNDTLSVNVSDKHETIIVYDYTQEITDGYLRAVVKARVEFNNVVLIILKDNDNHVNYMKLSNFYKSIQSVTAERTICSSTNAGLDLTQRNKTLMVQVSTKSVTNITVKVQIQEMTNFQLQLGIERKLIIGLMSPVFLSFKFEANVDLVNVVVQSDDNICMILSIQDAQCPVFDRPESVKFQSTYQTVTRSGSITIRNSTFKQSFFVVFVLTANEFECNRTIIPLIRRDNDEVQLKTLSVLIKKLPKESEYWFPILIVISFYVIFFIVALALSEIYKHCFYTKVTLEVHENDAVDNTLINPASLTAEELADMETIYSRSTKPRYGTRGHADRPMCSNDVLSVNNDDESFDHVPETVVNPDIFRLNKALFVFDLSKKAPHVMDRKYFLYFWYLVIISVFYGLPVVQLVIIYQTAVRTTGNQDMCFYNFKCTRPLSIFTAFNNIFSNIGYVLLGLLFTLITWRRHRLYHECIHKCKLKKCGIPQYYGLFFAMGLALIMEGVLSACYHICPSKSNFQFDTTYMYILACLCMIKIYQTRHTDINASAHSFYMTIALIVFIGVIGVLYNELFFWIVFPIIYIVFFIFLTIEIYYMGRWRLDLGSFRRLHIIVRNDKWKVFYPTYNKRMFILILLNLINFSMALYGAITMQSNFASYYLAIFMMNLFLYFAFYVALKVRHCEPFNLLNILYLVIAGVCWACALYCFFSPPTRWQGTPSQSRELNKDCLLFDFFDVHDIWHFLSSMSLFFSFMALMNLDDGICDAERTKIPVF